MELIRAGKVGVFSLKYGTIGAEWYGIIGAEWVLESRVNGKGAPFFLLDVFPNVKSEDRRKKRVGPLP